MIVKCSNCGLVNDLDLKSDPFVQNICGVCFLGSGLVAKLVPLNLADEKKDKICPMCDYPNLSHHVFCTHCGESLV